MLSFFRHFLMISLLMSKARASVMQPMAMGGCPCNSNMASPGGSTPAQQQQYFAGLQAQLQGQQPNGPNGNQAIAQAPQSTVNAVQYYPTGSPYANIAVPYNQYVGYGPANAGFDPFANINPYTGAPFTDPTKVIPQPPYANSTTADQNMLTRFNAERQKRNLPLWVKSPVFAWQADKLCTCLINSDPAACHPPSYNVFYGYVTANSPQDALDQITGRMLDRANTDEQGRPILSTDQRAMSDILGDARVTFVQGTAAYDPRWKRYAYVINYSY